jgi:hypothetical protein
VPAVPLAARQASRLDRLLLAGTIAFALLASAADECGTPSGAPLEVTCDAADEPNYSNHFPNGIIYDPVQDLTVYVDDGVTIEAGAN